MRIIIVRSIRLMMLALDLYVFLHTMTIIRSRSDVSLSTHRRHNL